MSRRAGPPFAEGVEALGREPMAWLAHWRERLGDLYALPVEGALLSRTPDCAGVIAVFGEAHHRTVLGDIDTFVLPPSAAVHLRLPSALHTLNAGLHSMRGDEHERHKPLLARVLAGADPGRLHIETEAAVAGVAADLISGGGLLAAMRRTTLRASSRLFFGEAGESRVSAAELMAYFQRRREAAVPGREPDADERTALIASGERADAQLRDYRRTARADPADSGFGVLAALARAPEDVLDEDGFVGHANVLFISCNEPVAVALTWTLLLLSQTPALRTRLREEATGASQARADDRADRSADGRSRAASPLLESVLDESLRVLAPNALMVRVTRHPAQLGAYRLPANCEVLLCPFLSHRDPTLFPQPLRFRPSRWAQTRPSPYAYFPFGAGGHGCVGRGLALRLLRECMAAWLAQGEIVLDGDTAVDWRVHVMLMPTHDPCVRLRTGATPARGGAWLGGIRSIVEFDREDTLADAVG